MALRFELLQEPTDTWAVFDLLTGVPVMSGDRPLCGLSLQRALRALKLMDSFRYTHHALVTQNSAVARARSPTGPRMTKAHGSAEVISDYRARPRPPWRPRL